MEVVEVEVVEVDVEVVDVEELVVLELEVVDVEDVELVDVEEVVVVLAVVVDVEEVVVTKLTLRVPVALAFAVVLWVVEDPTLTPPVTTQFPKAYPFGGEPYMLY